MQHRRILVVDDNPANLKLATFLLSTDGYDIQVATNAREACDVLATFRADLILLDIQLPDIDGLELTRRLKAAPDTREVKIVAVTAYAMKGDEEKARAAGVDGYISKPIDKTLLRRMVAEHFAERQHDERNDRTAPTPAHR